MSIKITQAAIEAGAKNDEQIMEAWGIIANAGGGDWSTQSAEWREAAARFRDKWVFDKSQSPPATATHVAIDDAEVERVAMVLSEHAPHAPFWNDASDVQKQQYRKQARAAIRAMQGQRWGVWASNKKTGRQLFVSIGMDGDEFTTDKAFCERACASFNNNNLEKDYTYEVRPYDAEGAKTPEQVAENILAPFAQSESVELVRGSANHGHLTKQIAAAIRAAKGGK